MRVIVRMTGTRPLLLHNVQLADPDNKWAKEIAKLTRKRTKTEDDRRLIADYEFLGGLYTNGGVVSVPTQNILKCFIECAKITKRGRMITRALTPCELSVPLAYKGPQDLDQLRQDLSFRDAQMVRIGGKRVLRTRPIFKSWGLSAEFELLTEAMDYDEFVAIVQKAGTVEGLGDGRSLGYGRFTGEVQEVALRRAA